MTRLLADFHTGSYLGKLHTHSFNICEQLACLGNMTEREWLSATDPTPMLEYLRGKVSERKLRLFAVACCRRIGHLIRHDWSKEAVLVAELHADRLVDEWVVEGRADESEQAIGRIALRSQTDEYAATAAAWAVAYPDRMCRVFEPSAVAAGLSVDEENWVDGQAQEYMRQCELLKCVLPNPFRPVAINPTWLTSDVLALATGIYEDRAFERMPILADALQDAGCENADILDHCRDEKQVHVRGCWVVDLLLGKS